jgi:hypothetical protein
VLDAADLGKVGEEKRIALLACLLHSARRRARDEVVGMFIKRMAAIQKRGRTELEESGSATGPSWSGCGSATCCRVRGKP